MNPRTRAYLQDALERAYFLAEETENATIDDFTSSHVLHAAIERWFLVIGEALARVDRLDKALIASHPDLKRWIGLRNVVAHQYDGLSDDLLWETASVKSHQLIRELEAILATEN